MPLLGRHKPAANNSQQQQAQQQQRQQQQQQQLQAQQQPVCESPLFGIRRQIGAKLSSTLLESSSIASSSSSSSSSAQKPQQARELTTTIPQQITRKQIHYAFTIMDNNKDGMVDLRDLSQMLANLGLPIDEAILSHIMSTSVSTRGDHRISELEFLDWISHFIEVRPDDSLPTVAEQRTSSEPKQAKGRAKAGPLKVARSPTAGAQLVAQPSEPAGQSVRNRRGSGSGLALMRSLGSACASASQAAGSSSSSASVKAAEKQQVRQQEQQRQAREAAEAEARDDLKAAFCVFDLDGDGFITVDEVQAGLRLLGEQWSNEELRQLFSRCTSSRPSATGGQCISIDDFVQLLL